jgi:hypothetical protein
MSKLNIVRGIKQKKETTSSKFGGSHHWELEKELGWDNRFHLGKLPDYDAFKDYNCKRV